MIRNLSLATRIGLGYLLIGLLVLLASGVGLIFASSVTRTIEATQRGLQQFDQLAQMERTWAEVAATVDRMLLTRQTGGTIQAELSASLTTYNEQLTALSSSAMGDIDPAMIETVQLLGAQLTELVGDITAVSRDGRWSRAQVIRHTEMSSLQRRFDDGLTLLRDTIRQDLDNSVNAAIQAQNILRFIWFGTVVVAAIIGTVGGIRVVGTITKPVDALIAQTRRVTQRDFSEITPLDSRDEIGQLSRAFAEMTDLLRTSYSELEQRVADRTRALLASTQVSRQLTTILNPDELVQEVVAQIDATFTYYHTHVYLFDQSGEFLVLSGSSGETGRQLLAAGHKIARGQGLVGRAAATTLPVLISDVSQAADWLPNTLLPETKSETAVPIMAGQDVLGVLDVQHNIINGIRQEDVELLQSIANQLAIALRNANLYAEAQEHARQEAQIRAISQKIQGTADMASAMQVAVRELGLAVNARQTAVRFISLPDAADIVPAGNGQNGHDQAEAGSPIPDKETS